MRRVTCVSLHALRVKLCVDLHLCSRMRSFVFYYTTVIVFCQVFVTSFLKKVLRSFSSLLALVLSHVFVLLALVLSCLGWRRVFVESGWFVSTGFRV